MGIWRKITGTLVINEVEDDEEDIMEEGKKKKKKGKKEDEEEGSSGTASAEMTFEERQVKKAELKYKKDPTCLDRVVFGKKVRLFYVIVLCLLLGLVLPLLLTVYVFKEEVVDERGYCGINVSWRFDCTPGITPQEEACHQLGCCYDPTTNGDMYAPLCFHSIPSEYGYTVYDSTQALHTSYPIFYSLKNQTELTLKLDFIRNVTNFGTTSLPLQVKIQRQGNDVLRILIRNTNQSFEPDDFVPEASDGNWQFDVQVTEEKGGDFNVSVSRSATRETIFETVYGPMIYSEDYMELTTRLPTSHIYGLGQRDNYDLIPNFEQRERWALYSREFDSADTLSYSSNPFYMNFEKTGNIYGLYLKNSAPIEVGVLPIPALAFRVVGGVFDLRFFAGPTPEDVSEQYTSMVGRPYMPPVWALGYHLCRTSLGLEHYNGTVQGMNEAEIPYESDCIDARLTYPDALSNMPDEVRERVDEMKNEGRKFVLVQYPFVSVEGDSYDSCKNAGALMEFNDSSYYGLIDKSSVAYPDYLSDNSKDWLRNDVNVQELYNMSDGIMLFRNTPLNEADLDYSAWEDSATPNCTPSNPQLCCPPSGLPFTPYPIEDINRGSLCPTLRHNPNYAATPTHREVHSRYGYYHQMRVYEEMKEINSSIRPFIMSQSTSPGSGQLGGQFGGAYFPDMVGQRKGLIQILEAGLAGTPLMGVPICGSVNSTTEAELRTEWCLRGHQVASFLPLMISHSEFGHQPRNPPDFSLAFSKQLKYYVRQRYMFLPYIYTLFYEANQMGRPVVRPLFYDFPMDLASRTISDQFLLGPSVLVCPSYQTVGSDTTATTQIHLPPGCWYNYYTGALVDAEDGLDIELPTLLTDINVYIKAGSIVPLQGNLNDRINTTQDSRQQPYTLLVALSCAKYTESNDSLAFGSLYIDDGETPLDANPPPVTHQLSFNSSGLELNVSRNIPEENCEGVDAGFSTIIDGLRVYGIEGQVTNVMVNEREANFTVEPDTEALVVAGMQYDWCGDEELNVKWM